MATINKDRYNTLLGILKDLKDNDARHDARFDWLRVAMTSGKKHISIYYPGVSFHGATFDYPTMYGGAVQGVKAF